MRFKSWARNFLLRAAGSASVASPTRPAIGAGGALMRRRPVDNYNAARRWLEALAAVSVGGGLAFLLYLLGAK